MQHNNAARFDPFFDASHDLVGRQSRIGVAGLDIPLNEPKSQCPDDIHGDVIIFPERRTKEDGLMGIVFAQQLDRTGDFVALFIRIVHGKMRVHLAVGAHLEKAYSQQFFDLRVMFGDPLT